MFKIIIIIVWDIKVFSSTNAEGPEEGGGRRRRWMGFGFDY